MSNGRTSRWSRKREVGVGRISLSYPRFAGERSVGGWPTVATAGSRDGGPDSAFCTGISYGTPNIGTRPDPKADQVPRAISCNNSGRTGMNVAASEVVHKRLAAEFAVFVVFFDVLHRAWGFAAGFVVQVHPTSVVAPGFERPCFEGFPVRRSRRRAAASAITPPHDARSRSLHAVFASFWPGNCECADQSHSVAHLSASGCARRPGRRLSRRAAQRSGDSPWVGRIRVGCGPLAALPQPSLGRDASPAPRTRSAFEAALNRSALEGCKKIEPPELL